MKQIILAIAAAGMLAFAGTADAAPRGHHRGHGHHGHRYHGHRGYRGGYVAPRYHGGYRSYPAYRYGYGAYPYGYRYGYPYGYGYQPGFSFGIGGPNGSFGITIR